MTSSPGPSTAPAWSSTSAGGRPPTSTSPTCSPTSSRRSSPWSCSWRFLLLMVVFRSLLIPLVASVMNLLSLGALNAVFNLGLGQLDPRPFRDGTDRRLHPGGHVLRALRPVHGLRGTPGQPDPGGVAPPAPHPDQ